MPALSVTDHLTLLVSVISFIAHDDHVRHTIGVRNNLNPNYYESCGTETFGIETFGIETFGTENTGYSGCSGT